MAERSISVKRGTHAGERTHADTVKFENAESALAREQADADARSPDWDLASRISTARAALERGVPAAVVRQAYGEKVFAALTDKRPKQKLAHAAG
jgi:hypothetical protein